MQYSVVEESLEGNSTDDVTSATFLEDPPPLPPRAYTKVGILFLTVSQALAM